MKKFIVAVGLALASIYPGYAQNNQEQNREMYFKKYKQEKLRQVDFLIYLENLRHQQVLNILKSYKACLRQALTVEDLKSCFRAMIVNTEKARKEMEKLKQSLIRREE